jgi:hypothetical protein
MNSNPLTCKTARKRLYFNNFKERLVHFNGTVMKNYLFENAIASPVPINTDPVIRLNILL